MALPASMALPPPNADHHVAAGFARAARTPSRTRSTVGSPATAKSARRSRRTRPRRGSARAARDHQGAAAHRARRGRDLAHRARAEDDAAGGGELEAHLPAFVAGEDVRRTSRWCAARPSWAPPCRARPGSARSPCGRAAASGGAVDLDQDEARGSSACWITSKRAMPGFLDALAARSPRWLPNASTNSGFTCT